MLWDEFGVSLGGEIAPPGAVEVEGITGLVSP